MVISASKTFYESVVKCSIVNCSLSCNDTDSCSAWTVSAPLKLWDRTHTESEQLNQQLILVTL